MKLNSNKILITTGIVLLCFGFITSFSGITGYFIFPTRDRQVNSIYGAGASIFGLGLMLIGFRKQRKEEEKEGLYDFNQAAFSLLADLEGLGRDAKGVENSGKELEEFREKEPMYKKNLQEGLEATRTKYRRFKSTVPQPLSTKDQEALYDIKRRIQNYKAVIEGLPVEYTELSASWKSKLVEWKGCLRLFAKKMLEFSEKYRDEKTIDETTSSYVARLHEYLEGFLRASYISGILNELPEINKKLHDALTNLETKTKYDMSKRP